eukprot:TRINITY_DN3260_c3_g2_i1.p1 TRINITY_DN3260_c3_g2~~TRINITY_DN3260_c3_g2_i1.p1  ORF type:complete len:766 (-),score=162.48 TRINITY_DN3260_c3_g2_i1:621-2918(-)
MSDGAIKFDRKKTEKVDFSAAISYIRSNYTAELADDCALAFQQLRQEACESILDTSSASLQALYRYHAALDSLSRRIPVEENNVRVLFIWYECFKQKRSTAYSWSLERASLLFNCAAQLSQMAAVQPRATADGLKAAGGFYQQAAGVLDMLRELLERQPVAASAASADLSAECLSLLGHVMLAQAQQCYVIKAANDSLKPAIVAKLAAQHAAFWQLATNSLHQHQSLASLLPKTWPAQLGLLEACARADACKWQAAAHEAADEYGLQVARLHQALQLLADARKRHAAAAADVSHCAALHTEIQQLAARADKDNDTIYHAPVPAESRLPALEAKSLVKPTVPPELVAAAADVGSERDRFRAIVPFALKERLSRYEQRRNALVQQQLSAIQEHNGIAIATLQSLNLPGCLDALEHRGADELLPAALGQEMEQIAAEGGHARLEELLDTRGKLAAEDAALVGRVRAALDQEEREDAALRSQNPLWPRTPSHTLTAQLRQELAQFAEKIEHARKSDDLVFSKYKQHEAWLVRLSATRSQLQQLLPATAACAQQLDGPAQQIVSELRSALGRLDSLIASRDVLRLQLADQSDIDEVSRALLSDDSGDDVFERALERLHAVAAQVAELAAQQRVLLEHIAQLHAQFTQARRAAGASAAQVQREAVLTSLATACRVFTELKANLGEGIKFYSHLQELLNMFVAKCTDFVTARSVEKTELQQPAPPALPPAQNQQPWSPMVVPVYSGGPGFPTAAQYPYYSQPYAYPPPPYRQ